MDVQALSRGAAGNSVGVGCQSRDSEDGDLCGGLLSVPVGGGHPDGYGDPLRIALPVGNDTAPDGAA